MIVLLKTLLLLLLLGLQAIAPLLHAHVLANHSVGIHLPELETYQTVDQTQRLTAVHVMPSEEGLFVSVNAGIDHSAKLNYQAKVKTFLAILCSPISILIFITKRLHQFPHSQPVLTRFIFCVFSPRAPPLFTS